MKVWICCWRRGDVNNVEDDAVFSTINPLNHERWFDDEYQIRDPKFRAYSLEFDTEVQHPGQRMAVLRGGPGV